MKSPSKLMSDLVQKIYHNYGENPGTMLVHTGAIGWILSSCAQIFAIAINNKLSPEQKMFLIPQEAADAAVNIVSFYTLTSGVKSIGSKLVKTGKIRTAEISKILEERGLVLKNGAKRETGKIYAGDWDFDITKLQHYGTNIKPTFKPFKDGAEVIAGLAGSITSCNIVTPIVRNVYASKKQKDIMNNYSDWKQNDPSGMHSRIGKTMFESFTSRTCSGAYYFGGNMKI